jgi:hypothetical protein
MVGTHTYVTKVPLFFSRVGIIASLAATIFSCPKPGIAQASTAQLHQPGPAESLYLELSSVGLDPGRVFKVRGASLDRSAIHITLEDGTIAFTKDVLGRITGAFFEGDGEVLLAPPNEVERKSLSLFTGMAILEERFSTAYFRFNDNSAAELQPGFRAPDEPEQFAARWDPTARNLAQVDAMRLLASFSELLPIAAGNHAASPPTSRTSPNDHMLHVRLQGNKLGVFDLFYDSSAGEQVEAGQSKTTDNGDRYYDVWTSFAPENPASRPSNGRQTAPALPVDAEVPEDRIDVRGYLIDAHVKPPKQLDADVELEVEARRGGWRFLAFELSRFLQVQRVEADGKAVEFIHNPAMEGTSLARSGNDMLALILPEPAQKGQRIKLHFVYGGEVLAEAGKGLLYVGERGTWYPNRGLTMADFDLTFHYPAGWTLLATGKPAPVSQRPPTGTQTETPGDEQVSHWISERPLPVAGFDLGKYVRGVAQAGEIKVGSYATPGVERNFPAPPISSFQVEPSPSPQVAPELQMAPALSPARNATAVAEAAAHAIRYYSERFGPFPYSQLSLTQLPGRESQGWPGLIFLSSFAFLNQAEREELHMNATSALIAQMIPAHETAHQWWGDLISWSTYRDQWLSEGLANYCALMMLQEKDPAGFRLIMEKYRKDLVSKNKEGNYPKDAGPVTLGARLVSSHFPEGYEAINYGRGTWLFYMLRAMLLDAAAEERRKDPSHKMVEDPFVRALRRVRERYEGKSISTRELLDVFAEDLPPPLRYEGKASLDWFLEGWINGTSLPRLELQSVKFVPKANSTIVTGMIRQKDAPDELVTSVPVYAMVSGKAPVLLGRVFADGPETSFRLSAPAGAHKLVLDPNGTLLTSPK